MCRVAGSGPFWSNITQADFLDSRTARRRLAEWGYFHIASGPMRAFLWISRFFSDNAGGRLAVRGTRTSPCPLRIVYVRFSVLGMTMTGSPFICRTVPAAMRPPQSEALGHCLNRQKRRILWGQTQAKHELNERNISMLWQGGVWMVQHIASGSLAWDWGSSSDRFGDSSKEPER